ncbi:MAG: DNA primase [Candidatus Paceibacterota bacterium]
MASDVETIKERLAIEEVVGSYVELKQSGKYLTAKSPFTNEKTPSFYVSPDKGLFHCFSSGKGGDVFTFIQEMEGVEFREALKLLADRAGVTLSGGSGDSGRKQRLRDIMAAARDFYVAHLKQQNEAKEYLKSRGVTGKTAATFSLGQAPDDWRQLTTHLESEGFKTADIIEAGLAKQPDANKSPYDRFRHRLMFPMNDPAGRTVAFSGRRLREEDNAKYINSPETPLFRKKEVLYGFNQAKDALRDQDAAILVEGQLDLVLAHQAGFQNAVAVSGTAITKKHLSLISRFTDNLIFALDTDRAGRDATLKSARLALTENMKPKVVDMPTDSDPADIITGEGKEVFSKLVAEAHDVIDAVLGWAEAETDTREEYLDMVQQQVFPLLRSIENKINQDHFISRVAQMSDIREETLRNELAKTMSEKQSSQSGIPQAKEQSPLAAAKENDRLTPDEQKHEIHKQLRAFCEWQSQQKQSVVDINETKTRIGEIVAYDMNDGFEDVEITEDQVMALDIAYNEAADKIIRRDLEELLLHFEARILQDTYEQASRQVKREEDKEKKKELLEKCQRISRRIHEIRETVRDLI